ncbi:DUF222 domain-containing protein [Cryobacterium sp. W22_MBD10_FK3]|uniref:HNH endonuclease signature motif containing protein n=1 Tax=Cryobacterium sp. W22_MBD10_FK3 TaxID=3240273 RepID=UPI003F93B86E
MDDELAPGSTAPTGTPPAGPNLHDWNTGLAGPEPEVLDELTAPRPDPGPDAASLRGATDTAGSTPSGPALGKPRPPWRDPSELPAVQRAHTGPFGEKLKALDDAAATVQAVMASIDVNGLSDAEVVALTQMVERAGRPVDAARVSTATVVGYRSRRMLGRESMAWRMGAPHQNVLLTRLTLASVPEMKRRMALGEKVTPRVLGGAAFEPVFPVVAAALRSGELGIDAAETIVAGLTDYTATGRLDADPAHVHKAERDLVEQATGSVYGRTPAPGETDTGSDDDGDADTAGDRHGDTNGDTGTDADADADGDRGPAGGFTGPIGRLGESDGFTYPADEIRKLAVRWQAVLNPDGLAPNAPTVEAKSTFSFGPYKDGLHPLRGGVTPELKGVMQNLFNTFQSARSAPSFPSAEEQQRIEAGELVPGELIDERSGGEKRADILRGILVQVAQDPRTPTMGGMPPTVMVHVNATDLLNQAGVGWIDGVDEPISMTTITQLIDNGGMQPLFFGTNGAVLGLGSKERCFTPKQRKAITARDGGCIIPGCDCPPQWTEVHHVTPWQSGGDTHVNNGVLLCWYHHHTITSGGGWKIRMVAGMPQVKAPHWIDPTGAWRPPNQHRAHDPRTRRTDE